MSASEILLPASLPREPSDLLTRSEGLSRGERAGGNNPAWCLEAGGFTLVGRMLAFPAWENQDSYLLQALPCEHLLAAVFDGHGLNGHHVATRVRSLFAEMAPALVADVGAPAALRQLFALSEAALQREGLCRLSGTTAIAVLVDQKTRMVTVAHVGDSTLLITRGDRVVFTTVDHKVDDETEKIVRARGGEVRCGNPPGDAVRRIFAYGMKWPGLSVSRALGDAEAKRLGVKAEPEISRGIALEPGMSIVMATDGVWETLPHEVAARCISERGRDPEQAARAMVYDARSRWPADEDIDDITLVAIKASEDSGGCGVR